MTGFWHKMLREPLLQFIAAGFVVFVAGEAYRRESDPTRIVMTPERERQLVQRYELQFGTPPDALTRGALVERDIEEEMLFRQGVALGLDRNDELVRRRIVQKMRFLLEDVSPPAEPTEAELRAFHSLNVERYATPVRVTFSHVYFSSERGGEGARTKALRMLDELRRNPHRRDAVGDPFPDLSHFSAYDAGQVRRLFGPTGMADAPFTVTPGRWSGPFESAYGWHLILVDRRQEASQRGFAAVRDEVRTDYLLDAQERANRHALSRLAAEFTVEREKS
jgi:hypothetical protein